VTPPQSSTVLVIGAGPAGCVTAATLARRGIQVLLADVPAAALSHGILVSGAAVRGLATIDLVWPARTPVNEVGLQFGTGPSHTVPDVGAVTCDSVLLRERLQRAAGQAGATLLHGRVNALTRQADGYRAVVNGTPVGSRHLVIATGAGPLPTQQPTAAGRLPTLRRLQAAHTVGLACAQRCAGGSLTGRMLLAMTAPAATSNREPPTCVWALPGAGGAVTIGACRLGDAQQSSAADLIAAALRLVTEADPDLAEMHAAGPVISGPVYTGFDPEHVIQAGCLLVGEAAGLANPFTGEGLSNATHSALLAADAITAQLGDPDAACRRYARRLSSTFVGYFETARHAAHRYHFTWRVLSAAAGSDHPFYAKSRRALLLPEGLSTLVGTERMQLPAPESALLDSFLAACDEILVSTIRREWPFLARLALSTGDAAHRELRPAVLFFAALLADGNRPDMLRAPLGAAIELGSLGALALLGRPTAAPPGRGIDWATAATVLASDFLLSQAYRMVAEWAPEVSWSFADWLAEMTALRASQLSAADDVPANAIFGALFEFPARIGAWLGGCPPEVVQAMRDFGQQVGCAFLHAEDVLALRGERTRLDTTLEAMLESQVSGVPGYLSQAVCGPKLRDRYPVAPPASVSCSDVRALGPEGVAIAIQAALDACRMSHRRALNAMTGVPSPAAVHILRSFAGTVAAPSQ
jgi:flavin-dependent dehydrogenase